MSSSERRHITARERRDMKSKKNSNNVTATEEKTETNTNNIKQPVTNEKASESKQGIY